MLWQACGITFSPNCCYFLLKKTLTYNYLNLLNADIGGDTYTEKDLCIFASFYY